MKEAASPDDELVSDIPAQGKHIEVPLEDETALMRRWRRLAKEFMEVVSTLTKS